jgi:hypothetical protein
MEWDPATGQYVLPHKASTLRLSKHVLCDWCVQVEWDAATGQYVLPHKAFTKVFQVRTELQLLDPSER